jgi:long-subunit acyl-CoA synthetase (AMP-forming)
MMAGYLNQPDRTAEVIQDGWYVTGDLATMDEDGFITITDRLRNRTVTSNRVVICDPGI